MIKNLIKNRLKWHDFNQILIGFLGLKTDFI